MTKAETKTHFKTVNIALISIFSALWVAFNFTLAPLGFTLTGLPTIHSVIIFFTLLLATWATNQFGAASLVGIIGSIIVLLAGGPIFVLGFTVASVVFDAILLVIHHRVNLKSFNIAVAVLATMVCGYLAGVIDAVFFIPNSSAAFALTFWGAWTMLGGIIGLAITLPIIAALEKANVKKVQAS